MKMKGIVPAAGLALALLASPLLANDVPGMVVKESPHSVSVTIDRLESVLEANDIAIALRWDHASNAEDAGIPLRETELLIFGNPEVGSHFFTSAQSAGIDLPLKALAWEDEEGQVWLGYNDPAHIAERHGIDDRAEVVQGMSQALDNLSDAATSVD